MIGFDSKEYIKNLWSELVINFDNAKQATTPWLKWAARENEIRRKIESILPYWVWVWSWCVIDTNWNVSKQIDIILYEKNYCPIFCINDKQESTYYPCEWVIAVWEVKSDIWKKELEDGFSKIASVKKLKRIAKWCINLSNQEVYSFRNYLSNTHFAGTLEESFNQDINFLDQIFWFILCNNFKLKIQTLEKHIISQVESIWMNAFPNMMLTLNNDIVVPYDLANNKLVWLASEKASHYYLYWHNINWSSFEYLILQLHKFIQNWRTVDQQAFQYYFLKDADKMPLKINKIINLLDSKS